MFKSKSWSEVTISVGTDTVQKTFAPEKVGLWNFYCVDYIGPELVKILALFCLDILYFNLWESWEIVVEHKLLSMGRSFRVERKDDEDEAADGRKRVCFIHT